MPAMVSAAPVSAWRSWSCDSGDVSPPCSRRHAVMVGASTGRQADSPMNEIEEHQTPRRRVISSLLVKVALLAATLVAGNPSRALAEVRVEGRPDAVRLETAGSSVEQVLAALGATYGLRY